MSISKQNNLHSYNYTNQYATINQLASSNSNAVLESSFDNYDETSTILIKEVLALKCAINEFNQIQINLSEFSLYYLNKHFPNNNEDYIKLVNNLEKFDKFSSTYPETIKLYKDSIGLEKLIRQMNCTHELNETAIAIIEIALLQEIKYYIKNANDPVFLLTYEGISQFVENLIINQKSNTPEKLSNYMKCWRFLIRPPEDKTDTVARKALFYMACSSVYPDDEDFKKINSYVDFLFQGMRFQDLFKFLNPLIFKIITERGHNYSPLQLEKIKKLYTTFSLSWLNMTNYQEGSVGAKLNVLKFNLLNDLKNSENTNNFDILIPAGWRQHGIMYLIHKEPSTNKYTISIFNTGQGISHHHYWKGKKVQTEASWANRNLIDIVNPDLIQKLYEFDAQDYDLNNNPYTYLTHCFGLQALSSQNALEFHNPQPIDNCVWKCTFRAIAKLLGEAEDPSLTLKVKEDLIGLTCEELKKIIPVENRIGIDPLLLSFGEKAQKRLEQKQIQIYDRRVSYEIFPEIIKNYFSFAEFLGNHKQAEEAGLEILWDKVQEQFTSDRPLMYRARDIRKWISHPKNVERLNQITALSLAYTQISVIPTEITYLKNLRFLDLTKNNIRVIPYEIAKLQNLILLILHQNPITFIPPNLPSHLTILKDPTM